MRIKLYDSLSKKKKTLPSRDISFYSCGPTVYNRAHIGNFRTYVLTDVLIKFLKNAGRRVNWVMNLTDVDEKTIAATRAHYGANAGTRDLKKLTGHFTGLFKDDARALNIDPPDKLIAATSRMGEIVKNIKTLISKGYAYHYGDSIYFDIKRYHGEFRDYGKLAGRGFLSGRRARARVDLDEYDKRQVNDFVLWRGYDQKRDGNIFWDDPILGRGRPGWHIECSSISLSEFGATVDIHSGGVEHLFPHHSNEIAQSQAITGYRPFAGLWLHFEHLLVGKKKMAKSLKNFITLSDLTKKKFRSLDLRFLYLSADYKTKQNFTWEALSAAQEGRRRLLDIISRAKSGGVSTKIRREFLSALADNFNLPKAVAIFFREIENFSIQDFNWFNQILGLFRASEITEMEMVKRRLMHMLGRQLKEREAARKKGNYKKADQLRQQINRRLKREGWQLADMPEGPGLIAL